MDPSEEKRKKTEKQLLNLSLLLPQSTPNPTLPDDSLLSCFARASRLYYPTISSVSKSCRSLLASPAMYNTRSFLNCAESCLYVCLRFPLDPNPCWFTLCRRPNLKTKKLTDNLLVPITSSHSAPVKGSSFGAVGSDIYEIGGLINDLSSSNVWLLDCRSNLWHQAPDMQVARNQPYAIAIDGKLHVRGGLKDSSSPNSTEVFDPKTQTWKIMSSDSCLIDNVLFYYNNGVFLWSDNKLRGGGWRVMIELPKYFDDGNSGNVQLVDYGGKMAVLWEGLIVLAIVMEG
ncbi:hypothetical protein EUTSA_v10026746mg [Eutrema salsugineum]|uniref:F-box domain-containing protein n=1 Tax=Eutrema salsugineum TaxID=72664 RepID=V4P9R2_EUTSA|nr:hypothetical protein EUTSA_v10026746mg [Eutrema salsugineum]